jgi:hypothetical protein
MGLGLEQVRISKKNTVYAGNLTSVNRIGIWLDEPRPCKNVCASRQVFVLKILNNELYRVCPCVTPGGQQILHVVYYRRNQGAV